MRYPIVTTADATAYLAGKRAGTAPNLDSLVKVRGDGPELPQEFVADLIADMDIDRDGQCDQDFFVNLCRRFRDRPVPGAKELTQAFKTLDT